MSEFLKPQSPLQHKDGAYVYPLTTADQVILEDNNRLNYALEHLVYVDEKNQESAVVPMDADTLGGKTESMLSVANANALAGHSADEFASSYDMSKIKGSVPFSFGVDENGNYGYIKAGADSVTPFRLGKVELLSVLTAGTGATSPYELSYQFIKNYSQAVIVIVSSDTDNNSDNFYKVYSVRNSSIASSSYTNYWNVTDNEWDYFKPILPANISYPASNSKYTNEKDLNKDMYWATGTSSANNFACIAYKNDIKSGDTAWMYINAYRRGIVMIFGVK